MSREVDEIFGKLKGSVSLAEAISCGLHLLEPKISTKAKQTFRNFTDKETICYIFCKVFGWQRRRLKRALKGLSEDTISDSTYRAVNKLKNVQKN